MILIFDYFETLVHSKSMDFNRGLKVMWEKYYKDKCTFAEISVFADTLFQHFLKVHQEGNEYAFVKDELPQYAEKYGGDIIKMAPEEEADFLMRCNEIENLPNIPEALFEFDKMGIPMYVLSNSGFTAAALSIILERLGIRKYFNKIWSSADFGRIKPCKDFFEMAIENVLSDNPTESREDIVFVGDTYSTDVVGANQAGLDVIWLNYNAESNPDNLPVHCIYNTGELIGKIKELRTTMLGRLRNMTSLYLVNDENMLLLYRQGGRVVNNVWTGSAGGHFEESELNDSRACVLREMQEELGITEDDIEGLSLRYVTLRRTEKEVRQNYYFFARLKQNLELVSNEGTLKWFPIKALHELEMPYTAKYVIEHYLEKGKYTTEMYVGVADGDKVQFIQFPVF